MTVNAFRTDVAGAKLDTSFPSILKKCNQRIEHYISENIAASKSHLNHAILYSLLNGGKRLRGSLILETAKIFSVSENISIQAAVSVECIHAYSLVHDDLPDMDNSDLRRGKPSCHVEYDNATAILVGDALQALAFELLSDPQWAVKSDIKLSLISSLAQAAGARGMVAGQMLDMQSSEISKKQSLEEIKTLQDLKTGKLFAFSCEAGAILGQATQEDIQALKTYADNLGLVFQIADDLLDIEGSSDETGKPVEQDTHKTTFVDLLGEDQAIVYASQLVTQGLESLERFGDKAQFLRDAMHFSLNRRH